MALVVIREGESKSEEAPELMRFLFLPLPPLPATRIEEIMYKGQSGMWSWLLHRITGLAILLFLLLHIVDISMIGFGPQAYDESIALFDSVIVRLLSLALIGAVLLHAFNGLRIMVIDFWRKGVRYQVLMFVIVLVITVVGFIPLAYYILYPILPFLHPHATTITK
jgi:succinate dehydrogenase / fumarate reductase cytochrome b subunit